jgi:HEAT repeat protein
LTVLIILEKAWRELRDRFRRARRRVLEPRVLAYAHGTETSIVSALGSAPRAGDRAVVAAILLDHVSRVRGIENERLCRALDELGFVDRFLDDLGSSNWWKRAEAAERLGLAGAKRATPQLSAALMDEVPEVRLRAAKALGLVGGRAAVLPLVHALSEPNRWSTIRIADVLAAMGRDVVAELIEAFPKQNAHAKLAALDILGRIRAHEAVPWLTKQLSAGERDVQRAPRTRWGRSASPIRRPICRRRSRMRNGRCARWPRKRSARCATTRRFLRSARRSAIASGGFEPTPRKRSV